ncbi:CBD9-like protein [Periconia macrospinosa]|uniref:CBD9-like protein n=1 Tax=Periconia macrospinosa TaxID=97972 RepID=A0A2V1DU23_9PLEO|nr:CBD9-like protein [Periconia macrospinosa]
MKHIKILTTLFGVLNVCRGSEPAQLCQIEPLQHTNMCMAVTSIKSPYERGHDLLMTFSVMFRQRNGWAAFAAGNIMDRALMFVMWPGEQEGDITFSVRSTTGHLPPQPLKNQEQVQVQTARIDERGFHVLQVTCHACETIGLGELNVTSQNQPWLFATSYAQQTKSSDPNLRMTLHTDYGQRMIDMAQALSTASNTDHPRVTTDRSSIHVVDSPGPHQLNGSTSSMNAWQAHGLILSVSVVLNCIGIVLIRSGAKWAFRSHWIVQACSASGLLIGGIIGVVKSQSIFQIQTLSSTHKLIGLAIMVGLPVQITAGYKHHINYVKYNRRTGSSFFHINLGRILFLALNINVFMGLWHARQRNAYIWGWGAVFFLESSAIIWVFLMNRRGVRKDYKNVPDHEIDPFEVGDDEEK